MKEEYKLKELLKLKSYVLENEECSDIMQAQLRAQVELLGYILEIEGHDRWWDDEPWGI